MSGDTTREKAIDALKKQIREQKARIDPAVLQRAQEAVAAKASAATSVPYDREAAQAAVEMFLKSHTDAKAFSLKLAALIRKEAN